MSKNIHSFQCSNATEKQKNVRTLVEMSSRHLRQARPDRLRSLTSRVSVEIEAPPAHGPPPPSLCAANPPPLLRLTRLFARLPSAPVTPPPAVLHDAARCLGGLVRVDRRGGGPAEGGGRVGHLGHTDGRRRDGARRGGEHFSRGGGGVGRHVLRLCALAVSSRSSSCQCIFCNRWNSYAAPRPSSTATSAETAALCAVMQHTWRHSSGDAAHVAALVVGVVVRRAAVVMRVLPPVWWCGSGPRVELELEAVFVVGVAPRGGGGCFVVQSFFY